jgi:gamma-resorcylate decarboxylase
VARRSNDYLAEHIAKYPKRLKGFAALPLQDPQAAAQELTRCVKELSFCGALVFGFSQVGTADSAVFYDLPQCRAFWAAVQELDVPVSIFIPACPCQLASSAPPDGQRPVR